MFFFNKCETQNSKSNRARHHKIQGEASASASASSAAAAEGAGGTVAAAEDPVVAVAWGDHRGALAVLWSSGTLAVLENPGVVGGWDAVSWFKTTHRPPAAAEEGKGRVGASGSKPSGPAIPVTAGVTLRWSCHSLLLAVGDSLEVFAFHDYLEVCAVWNGVGVL